MKPRSGWDIRSREHDDRVVRRRQSRYGRGQGCCSTGLHGEAEGAPQAPLSLLDRFVADEQRGGAQPPGDVDCNASGAARAEAVDGDTADLDVDDLAGVERSGQAGGGGRLDRDDGVAVLKRQAHAREEAAAAAADKDWSAGLDLLGELLPQGALACHDRFGVVGVYVVGAVLLCMGEAGRQCVGVEAVDAVQSCAVGRDEGRLGRTEPALYGQGRARRSGLPVRKDADT